MRHNPESWGHNHGYCPVDKEPDCTGENQCDPGRADNKPKLIPWNALAESVDTIVQGVNPDSIAQMTLQVAYQAARRLGGFRAKFNLQTSAHTMGGTVLVPVPAGWTIAQVVSPRNVSVEGDLIIFNSIHSHHGHHHHGGLHHDGNLYHHHGYVPRDGEFIPPQGISTDPHVAHHDNEGICVTVLLKPRISEQCADGLPLEVYENYHDVLLYGVLAQVFLTGGHIDHRLNQKYRAEYGYAIRQVRNEQSKRKNNKHLKLDTGGFLFE